MTLRNIIKKAIKPVIRKPWNTDDMEAHYGIWIGVSALYNDSGRQLGEENSRPFILNHHIPTTTIDCKYDGSRMGHAINMSALRIAMTNFDAVMDITRSVRDYHMTQQGKENQQPGIWDLYLISRASVAIIAYQKRAVAFSDNSDVIRDDLASQYQFISGVFMICRDMLNRADPMIEENIAISAEDLYDYADRHGIFLSDNGMACAGSTKKIMEFLELCNSGSTGQATDSHSILETLTGNMKNWYSYAILTVELDCYFEAEAQRRRIGENIDNEGMQQTSSIYYNYIAIYCRDILKLSSLTKTPSSFEQGVLERQNIILKLLGKKPLKSLSQTHINIRLGIQD